MITRREFSKSVLAGGAALVTSGDLASATSPAVTAPQDEGSNKIKKYDLLIKGGTVVDPAQNLHAPLDVAVVDGKIFEVSANIPESQADEIVSAKGRIVTPGFIDIHVHVFEGYGEAGVNADHYCLGRGVTTVVDAGSSGYMAINRFVKDIVDTSITRIHPLVHIGATGAGNGLPIPMDDLYMVNPHLTAKAAEYNKPAVVGIKVHPAKSNSSHPKDVELEFVKRGLEAGGACHLPVMVHINETYNPLPVILNMLRKGDIFTHCFDGYPQDSPLDANGKILPEVWDARDRGVIFDIAEGVMHKHFNFDVAEKCLQQGFLPDTLSSDMSRAHYQAGDLTTVVSHLMAIGMDLDKAIERVTIKPAQVFDFGMPLGTLKVGSEADITICELQDGRFEFAAGGTKRAGRQNLVNKAVVRRGRLYVNQI
jgi:dihydroorotase